MVENWGNGTGSENEESEARVRNLGLRLRSSRFVQDSMREYIPCMDNEEAIRQLKSP